MSDYKRASLEILERLGPDFSGAGQFDIRIKKMSENSAILIRTMDDIGGPKVLYGLKFFAVDRLLSLSLSPWLNKRPNPFKEHWSCLFWSPLSQAHRYPQDIRKYVEEVISSSALSLQDSLYIAWNSKLTDGISKYEWPAACSILRNKTLFEEVSNFFKNGMSNQMDYSEQLSSIWREGESATY